MGRTPNTEECTPRTKPNARPPEKIHLFFCPAGITGTQPGVVQGSIFSSENTHLFALHMIVPLSFCTSLTLSHFLSLSLSSCHTSSSINYIYTIMQCKLLNYMSSSSEHQPTSHTTPHTRVKQNALCFLQKDTQPSQTYYGGHIIPNPIQYQCG